MFRVDKLSSVQVRRLVGHLVDYFALRRCPLSIFQARYHFPNQGSASLLCLSSGIAAQTGATFHGIIAPVCWKLVTILRPHGS